MSDEEVIEVTVDINELKKLKVAELKRKLAEFGLDNKGTKAELIARVEKYLTEQEEADEDLLEEEEGEDSEEIIDELVSGEGSGAVGGGGEGEGETATATAASAGGENEEKGGGKTEQDKATDTSTTKRSESGSGVSAEESVTVGRVAPSTSGEGKEAATTNKVSLSGLSGAERLARRAARFGENTSIEAKKMARAERFGTSLENGVYKGLGKRPLTDDEMERLRKRGERFGTTVSPAIALVEDDERKKKRIEKFGLSTIELSEEDRKKKRAEKFGT